MRLLYFFMLVGWLGYTACNPAPPVNPGPSEPDTDWDIPIDQVLDGGPGKDGIPSVDQPVFVSAKAMEYLLEEDDLVIGVEINGEVRAYPHKILDHHEVVNDVIQGVPISVNYCPLTGTGMAWGREFQDEAFEFGVSGLLYNSNLILYDRATNSHWPQMLMRSAEGERKGNTPKQYPVVETTFATWKKMYPEAKVLSANTGFYFLYSNFPYLDYKTFPGIFFPVQHMNDSLFSKERVLGFRVNFKLLAFRFEKFRDGTQVYQSSFNGIPMVAVGNASDSLMLAFSSRTEEGEILDFSPVEDAYPVIMTDASGSEWSVFGQAISGPHKGKKLRHLPSLMGYWFTFPAFYPGEVQIF